jgi:hypothetical protein
MSADRRPAARPTHYTPRGIRRAAAAAAGLNPRQWRQLEQLVDAGCAWLPASATVPIGAINATHGAVDGMQRLAELGLADGTGNSPEDRWQATDAGYELVMSTRGRDATLQRALAHAGRTNYV